MSNNALDRAKDRKPEREPPINTKKKFHPRQAPILTAHQKILRELGYEVHDEPIQPDSLWQRP